MIQLILGTAAFLALPARAGDLGKADIHNRNDLPLISEFKAQCVGPLDKWGGAGPECVVKFTNNKMSVDDSKGISRDQIVSIAGYAGSPGKKYVDVLYRTSTGKVSAGQFGFIRGNTAKQFMNTLTRFMSGDIAESETDS